MSVLISNDAELDTLLDAQEVEHICEVVLAAESVEREVEISLSYVDEDEMHELNHEWRGIDRTTDVLSFGFGNSLRRETGYLTIHSILHLLGYDHMDEGEMKRQMRTREEIIAGQLGLQR